MGWEVNNFTLGGGLGIILEGIGKIRNVYDEVVGGRNGNNQTECMWC